MRAQYPSDPQMDSLAVVRGQPVPGHHAGNTSDVQMVAVPSSPPRVLTPGSAGGDSLQPHFRRQIQSPTRVNEELRGEVAHLQNALMEQRYQERAAARSVLEHQRHGFERAAREYETQAHDHIQVQVAQSSARLRGEYMGAISATRQ